MRKIKNLLTLLAAFSVLLCFLSCGSNYCEDGKYYCSSVNSCCPADMRYNDGKGTCFSTLTACTNTGNACITCHPETE